MARAPLGVRINEEASYRRHCFGGRLMRWTSSATAWLTVISSRAAAFPRFHVLHLADGTVSSHLVARGRGSDQLRTGWLKRFSNAGGSNASSRAAERAELCDPSRYTRASPISGPTQALALKCGGLALSPPPPGGGSAEEEKGNLRQVSSTPCQPKEKMC
jgi:hypothetical protein